MCGKIIGYQYGSPEGFGPYYHNNFNLGISDSYVDGLSLTHGISPRNHLWTFVAAVDETRSNQFVCPCTKTDAIYTGIVPPFVGQDYFCDTGSEYDAYATQPQFYYQDPLWDGSGCGSTSSCCGFNNPPWFCKQLTQPTIDDIELRACVNANINNEDVAIESIDCLL